MKFIVLGTSGFTLKCAQALLDQGVVVSAIFSLPKENLPLNSADIEAFSKKNEMGYHEFGNLSSSEALAALRSYSPDYILSTWPHILGAEVLHLPRHFVIGTHPTQLPFNRGRHPLHWLIVLGIEKTALSFFVMDEKIDNGGILAQVDFTIPSGQSIGYALSQMDAAAAKGIEQLIQNLANAEFKPEIQQNQQANYWRKRTQHDIILDPRLSGSLLTKIINSFTLPYPCALLIYQQQAFRIARARIVTTDYAAQRIENMEHGLILFAKDDILILKVDGDVLELTAVDPFSPELLKARYIHPPSFYFDKYPVELNQLLKRRS